MKASEHVARAFHETYEALAPSFGYVTRPESRGIPWDRIHPNNRRLVIATVETLIARGLIHVQPDR